MIPGQVLSIDEGMVPFKGRLSFKQYMKDKPTKWGLKCFLLCDAQTGYMHKFSVYTGKNQDYYFVIEVLLLSEVMIEATNKT